MTDTQNDTQNDSGLSTADLANASDSQGGSSTATMSQAAPGSTQVETRPSSDSAPLFNPDESKEYKSRWQEIQAGFVDDPKNAVQQADGLVADIIQQLAKIFAEERNTLEDQWSSGGDADTETLRMALQRYRSFFDRLLSV